MIDLTPIIEAVTGLAVALILYVLIPWVKSQRSNEDVRELMAWVKIGVQAAEQIYNANDGPEKKKYVLNFLETQGYHIDSAEIDSAIESAVLELHSALYGGSYAGSQE
jgi:hypothetical protein